MNTVNCMGVMGKGLALQFKTQYPHMFSVYQRMCDQRLLDIGKLWIYKTERRWILNFPTKYDWRLPSQEGYLEKGLEKFMKTYKLRGITSVAFPLLGANNGGLSPEVSFDLMHHYLRHCDIPVSIYLTYKGEENLLF